MVDRTSGNVINQMQVAHGTDNTTTTDIDESSAEVKAVWQAILADGGGTTAVGSYKASPAGAFDMAGNAYEFTRDWYTVSAYLTLAGTTTDPSIEDESTLTEADKLGGSDGDIDGNGVGQATRIIRGGSWYAQKTSCRTFPRSETRAASNAGFHSVGFRVVALNPIRESVATVSAASYLGPSLAGDSIVSVFGANLATGTPAADSISLPLSLLGTSVKVKDSLGTENTASLLFVSPGQVNYVIPPGLTTGTATTTITNANGTSVTDTILIRAVAPGLFAANAVATGVVAGYVQRVKANGASTFESIIQYDSASKRQIAAAVDLSSTTDKVYLIIFGTGFRNRSSLSGITCDIGGIGTTVEYAGMQGYYVGLDQINILLPLSLAGKGEVNIVLRVEGISANIVTVKFA